MDRFGRLLLVLVAWSALADRAAADTARLSGTLPARALGDWFDEALAAESQGDADRLAAARAAWNQARTLALAEFDSFEPGSDAPRRLLEFLHARVLRGHYRADASRASEALVGGDYNCLSATLLYCGLADALAIEAEAISWPGHVACRVRFAGQSIEVEPTCREWFQTADTASRAELRRRALAEGGLQIDAAAARTLDRRGLLALVSFNLGTEQLREGDALSAAAALERALALDPENPSIRANLLAALTGQAAALHRAGDASAARALLERCRRIAPEDRLTLENLARVEQAGR